MKKIIYLGPIDEYITLLKAEIAESIPECELILQKKSGVFHSYESISHFNPQIVLINYSEQKNLGDYFSIMIKKGLGNVTFVLLSPNKDAVVEIEKLSTLGDYIHIIKNPTVDEVVEYIAKKMAIPRRTTNHKKVYFKDSLQLFYAIRIAYLGRTHAQIETNRFYENNSTIQLTLPFMVDLINSNQHKLTKRSTEAIYSHFRYSYQLEYMFQTNKLEPAVRSRQIKDLRYEISTFEINEKAYQGIIEATKEKNFLVLAEDKKKDIKNISEETLEQNELELLSRTAFFNRLITQTMEGYTTRDTVSIYDKQALLLKELDKIEQNNVQVIHRDEIGDSNTEMVSDKPSLIVINLDKKNTLEKVKQMISAVTLLKDHFPFILLFNYQGDLSSDDLRHWLEYHFVLAAPDEPSQYLLIRMLEIYRRKKQEKEMQKADKRLKELLAKDVNFIKLSEKFLLDYKAYKHIHDPESLIIKYVPAEVIWLSETEIKFKTNEPIEIGEIFRLKNPFDMQIEIISKEKGDPNDPTINYVAHMSFLAETDKMALKGFINESAQYSSLNEEQLSDLKEKYFPFKFDFNL